MLSGRVVIGLFGLIGIVALACSAAFAATMSADLYPADKPALSDLTLVDALGYACIPEKDIDLAFYATGKGMRLPRTCLPEPCEAALTPVQLAGLIGRDPYQREWDDYFSRYADVCRKEVVPFDEAAGPVAGVANDAVAFWAPLAARYPAGAPIRGNLPSVSGPLLAGSSSNLTEGPGSTGPTWGTDFEVPAEHPDPDDPIGDEPEPKVPPTPPLPVVPLPAAWILFMTGAMSLWLRRRVGST